MEENKEISMEVLEQVGQAFVQFMKAQYDDLKQEYHKDPNIKKMMDLPSYCFTMFVLAIKSYDNSN